MQWCFLKKVWNKITKKNTVDHVKVREEMGEKKDVACKVIDTIIKINVL